MGYGALQKRCPKQPLAGAVLFQETLADALAKHYVSSK